MKTGRIRCGRRGCGRVLRDFDREYAEWQKHERITHQNAAYDIDPASDNFDIGRDLPSEMLEAARGGRRLRGKISGGRSDGLVWSVTCGCGAAYTVNGFELFDRYRAATTAGTDVYL